MQSSHRRSARSLAALGSLLSLLLVAGGCASPVDVHVDDGADFAGYGTWGWQPRAGDEPLPAPSALDVQVARQIHQVLLDRGLHYVRDEPDLFVSAQLVVTRQQVTEQYTPATQFVPSFKETGSFDVQVTRTRVQYFERGELRVAVRESRRGREVWSGQVAARYKDRFGPHVDEIVGRLVGRFPMSGEGASDTDPRAIAMAARRDAESAAKADR